ncbi:MAG: ROK family protein, partial [Bacteroidota bacterium]
YARVTGRQLPLKVIDEAHRAGSDPHATATINRLVVNFGKAMAALVNILDPAVVVLGGGVGNIEDLYTRGPAAVQKHLFNPTLDTQFLRPKLGDSAGVFGAAMLTAP